MSKSHLKKIIYIYIYIYILDIWLKRSRKNAKILNELKKQTPLALTFTFLANKAHSLYSWKLKT